MRTWKESLKMFRYNLPSVILFEIIYKLLSMAVLLPVIYSIINYSVKLAGIKYLTGGYMTKYFSKPSTYLLLLVVLILIGIYILINMSAVIYAMESSHRREKTNAIVLLLKGFGNALRIINPKNMGLMLHVILIIPYTYTAIISGSLLGIKLPDFVKRMLSKHAVIVAIVVGCYLLVGIVAMLRIYVLNYYTLYRLNYKESVMMSKKMIKRHVLRDVLGVIMYNVVIMLVLLLLQAVFATVFAGIIKNIVSYKQLKFVVNTAIQILFVILYILISLISTPLVYSFICAGFYRVEGDAAYDEYKKVKQRRHKDDAGVDFEKQKKKQKLVSLVMILIGLVLNGAYIYLAVNNRVILNIAYSNRASVTAHRGDAENAPENTMAAFELALENQADIIELDVRQTKDGKYIIMHDESLYRTTGVNKNVGELDFAEIEQLDAGSSFSEQYAGEHIPTLQEVLDFAEENDIFLNIELKPADTDKNYEEGIVGILEENDFIEQCVVASADYAVVRRVKELNPDITTVYIMSMAFGEIGDMEDVDIFSIKHTFISANMVKNIHKNGKEIYAWTVNNEEVIKRLLLLDVDSIITDDPYTTKEVIFNANDSLLSDWLQRLVENY